MRLTILANRPIGELQSEFSTEFSFLKIEFFSAKNRFKKLPIPAASLPPSTNIKDAYMGSVKEGELQFNEQTTVAELEELFLDEFNLHVQVFRKSGNLWLETTVTDSWTLHQQNEHGREISEGMRAEKKYGSPDYQLTRDTED